MSTEDQYHQGENGSVFDGSVEDRGPILMEAHQMLVDGRAINDAVALVTAGRHNRARLLAVEVDVMRDGTSRVMSTVTALAVMAGVWMEDAARSVGCTPEEFLQRWALRQQSRGRHPSSGDAD